jgi:hypothetical protein
VPDHFNFAGEIDLQFDATITALDTCSIVALSGQAPTAHMTAPCQMTAGGPTPAFHPRRSLVPDEMDCRPENRLRTRRNIARTATGSRPKATDSMRSQVSVSSCQGRFLELC